MVTAGEATASVGMVEEATTVELAAWPTVDDQAEEQRAPVVWVPMSANRARVQIIVHRPSRHRAAVLRTAGPRMRVERVPTQLMPNRMPRHRAATHRTEAENKPAAAADIPAGPTTNDRLLQRQTADGAILGGAYQLRRFAFGEEMRQLTRSG